MRDLIKICIVLLAVSLCSCNGKFHHFEFHDFKYLYNKDTSKTMTYSTKFIENKIFVLRLNKRVEYIGNELVRFQDTTSKKDNHHLSYFILKDDGRVFYNTFAEDRDTSNIAKSKWHTQGKIPVFDVKNKAYHYSRQGYYRLIEYEVARRVTDQKSVFKSTKKMFIEMELERKTNNRLKETHYIIRGEIDRDDNSTKDTLHLLDIKIKRKFTPIRKLNSIDGNKQQIRLDGLFNFDLNFLEVDTMDYDDGNFVTFQ